MRLIDADTLLKEIKGFTNLSSNYFANADLLEETINNQPTAYDVDKVVELLKDWIAEADIVRPFDNKVITGKKVIASENAIGIVRDGGV